MNFYVSKEFNECIENYKKLNLKEKVQIAETEMKELMAALVEINIQKGYTPKVLYNKEIRELDTFDDFVEATYVYINSLKELLGDYVNIGERK